MSGVIEWSEPPRPARAAVAHDWEAIAEDLRSRPGQWAMVALCRNSATAASTARYIRENKYKPLRRGVWEATARTIGAEFRLYARYIGETPP